MEARRASFLVRIWQDPQTDEGVQPQWRASVEFIETEEEYFFEDVDSLIAFLQEAVEGFEELALEPEQAVA